jgi:hypothetical protein
MEMNVRINWREVIHVVYSGVLRHVLCASNSLNANQEQVSITLHPFIALFLTVTQNQFLGS